MSQSFSMACIKSQFARGMTAVLRIIPRTKSQTYARRRCALRTTGPKQIPDNRKKWERCDQPHRSRVLNWEMASEVGTTGRAQCHPSDLRARQATPRHRLRIFFCTLRKPCSSEHRGYGRGDWLGRHVDDVSWLQSAAVLLCYPAEVQLVLR